MINNKNTFFMNVDTQKDFMNEDGSLYVQGAEVIKPTLAKLTQYAKENNIKVVNTADWHYDDSEELSDEPDFINTFPPHCMANTDGVWYVEETTPVDDINITFRWDAKDYSEKFINGIMESKVREIIITKDKFDVFSGNPYTDRITNALKETGYTDVIVYGVATNVCVNCAVLGLLERGFNVTVVEDAIKELPDIPSPIESWIEKGATLTTFDQL
jgi:nicotinamidase/pyrazinamidase